jgi:hypothetical protein
VGFFEEVLVCGGWDAEDDVVVFPFGLGRRHVCCRSAMVAAFG